MVKCIPSLKMDAVTQVQVLDKAVGISCCADTFGKTMNPIIVTIAMGKIVRQTVSLVLMRQPV